MMEYVEGQTLSAILRRNGFLPVGEALPIFSACCSALFHAHAEGVVHRDIKPGNIMVGTNDQTKLLDFGLARFLYDERQDLTMSGTALGAVHYMSPEQALGRPVDGRGDVYSLACVIYEVLCGRPVFEGNSAFAVLEKHIRVPVRKMFVNGRAHHISPALEAVVLKALEKDPNKRFQNAEDFDQALRTAASITGLVPMPKAAFIAAAAISSMFLFAYLFLLVTHHI
jgi:serine/threonine-protein kinase